MADQPLLVTPEVVGRRLGLTTLTAEQRVSIEDAIVEAQDAVVAHIGRPLAPVEVTRDGLYPIPGEDPMSWRAWGVGQFDEAFTVVSATRQSDGAYTVVFRVGLDAAQERPIIRYVRAHAVEDVRNNPSMSMAKRAVTSMGAEGQSLSFESTRVSAGSAGALPTLDTLNRYRRQVAYQANRKWPGPWPMTSAPVGWDPR